MRAIVADGRCPDLSGLYREEGTTIRGGEPSSDAHLSWLIPGERARNAGVVLNTMPGPGKPSEFLVKSIRLEQSIPDRFALNALDQSGRSLGVFDFGPEDGWRCGQGAFFVYREEESGGEGTWGNVVSLHKLFRTSDGTLVRAIRESYQQRSVFALGGTVGTPKTVEVDYRFAQIER
jgi:hypothetical protein